MSDRNLSTESSSVNPESYYAGGNPELLTGLADEMSEAFGWDEPISDEDLELMYQEDCRRNDEEADRNAVNELVGGYPGMQQLNDEALKDIVANPPGLFGDCDEVVTVASILLDERRKLIEALAASIERVA